MFLGSAKNSGLTKTENASGSQVHPVETLSKNYGAQHNANTSKTKLFRAGKLVIFLNIFFKMSFLTVIFNFFSALSAHNLFRFNR